MRLEKQIAPVTINSEVRVLRAILNWCHREELLDRVPVFEALPEKRRRIDLPTLQEIIAIRTQMKPHHAALVRLIVETGCRQSEAFKTRWKDIELEGGYLHIYPDEERSVKTTGSARTLPLSEGLLCELDALPREGAWVFPARNKVGPITNIQRALDTAVKRAGLTRNGEPLKVSVKHLRKVFITYQLARGIDRGIVQQAAGHAPGSQVTDRNYLHLPGTLPRETMLDLDTETAASKMAAPGAFGSDTKIGVM